MFRRRGGGLRAVGVTDWRKREREVKSCLMEMAVTGAAVVTILLKT